MNVFYYHSPESTYLPTGERKRFFEFFQKWRPTCLETCSEKLISKVSFNISLAFGGIIYFFQNSLGPKPFKIPTLIGAQCVSIAFEKKNLCLISTGNIFPTALAKLRAFHLNLIFLIRGERFSNLNWRPMRQFITFGDIFKINICVGLILFPLFHSFEKLCINQKLVPIFALIFNLN